jgi:hypothetical protein
MVVGLGVFFACADHVKRSRAVVGEESLASKIWIGRAAAGEVRHAVRDASLVALRDAMTALSERVTRACFQVWTSRSARQRHVCELHAIMEVVRTIRESQKAPTLAIGSYFTVNWWRWKNCSEMTVDELMS